MSEEMKQIISAMQEAVDAEMERKAKLGYYAVVRDEHGGPKLVLAKELIRETRFGNCSRSNVV